MSFVTKPVKNYSESVDRKQLKQLRELYGQNKIIPKECELQALRALSHYPELQEVQITFRFRKQQLGHSSQPDPKTLFSPKQKRSYIINISSQTNSQMELTRFPHLSYNAQIGVLSHELAHTVEYISKSSFWLIGVGIKYVMGFKLYKLHFENDTDLRAIDHGAGYQLLAWSKQVHSFLEKVGRGKNYLEPKKIENIISSHSLYK